MRAWRIGCWMACCAGLLAPAPARANPPPVDDATRNAARELAHRGTDAFERGDYATAYDLFRRSYSLIAAPTLSLREARSLEKLGRWVEAAEAYMRTIRTPLDDGAPQPFRKAVQAARQELAALDPRIPRLTVVVTGAEPSAADLRVTLDGKTLAAALIGVEVPVDPGLHRLTARTHGAAAEAALELVPGSRQSVTLALVPDAPAAPSARSAASERRPLLDQRSWAVLAMGTGAAVLSAGVVSGVMAAERHEDAERSCPSSRCLRGSQGEHDLNAFRDLRTVSTVTYLVGAAMLGSGIALWLTAAPRRNPRAAGAAAFIGLRGAGVRGRF